VLHRDCRRVAEYLDVTRSRRSASEVWRIRSVTGAAVIAKHSVITVMQQSCKYYLLTERLMHLAAGPDGAMIIELTAVFIAERL